MAEENQEEKGQTVANCAGKAEVDPSAIGPIQAGDEATLAGLVAEHGPTLYSIVHRIVTDKEDAVGVVQNSFLKAVENIDEFKAAGIGFRHWLYRIAVRAALDLRRRRNDEIESSALEQARPRDLRSTINAAISRLPENSCAALALLNGGGLGYREIAEVLQIPAGTVMNRIFQSRQKLWEILASEIV